MAITTIDGLLTGFRPPVSFFKGSSGTLVAGRLFTPLLTAGIPGAAVMPTPGMAGQALASLAGQIDFTDAPEGQETRLARFVCTQSSGSSSVVTLADMLWCNSDMSMISTAVQTINSVAFPARDNNGSTNGEGVTLAILVSGQTGSGSPAITVNYTNSDGVSGRSATNATPTSANTAFGGMFRIGLQAGDRGVRSVQSIQLSASWVSGAVNLIAMREISTVVLPGSGITSIVDAVTGGMPVLHNGTVPFLLIMPSGTTATQLSGMICYAQG